MHDMRTLINIAEGTTPPALYHGTRHDFPIGFVIKPQPGGYTSGDDAETRKLERFLEQHRPEGCIARQQAVFMVADVSQIDAAGGYEDYIYRAEPIGAVTRANLRWYGDLYGESFGRLGTKRHIMMAQNYWTGAPYTGEDPHGRGDVFEFIAASATLVELVGGEAL